MLRKFRDFKFYLLKYEFSHLLILSLGIFIFSALNLWHFKSFSLLFLICSPLLINGPIGYLVMTGLVFHFLIPESSLSHLYSNGLLMVLGICTGFCHMQIVHNSSHHLFKPRWLNRIIGELCSIQFFGTFLGFTVLHMKHHSYADHLDFDPHPNLGSGFFPYVKKLSFTMKESFKKEYFTNHGQSLLTKRIWIIYCLLIPIRHYLRALFLLIFFGPIGFLFFMVPSLIANHWIFAHLNYYAHLRQDDGNVEILNLNKKFSHRILDFLTIGAYHHANHHKNPNYFNPSKIKSGSI